MSKARLQQAMAVVTVALVTLSTAASAESESDADSPRLFDLSLSELISLEVSSASYRQETQLTAPIAINSIGAEQIRQSNATSIPEVLRLLPGVIVKQVTHGNYTVDVRGFDGVVPGNAPPFSTNSGVLVLLDGEPVFNYFTGGVYWPSLGINVQDVESIEVVRGPATAMYGPNAANGVISIRSKTPSETGWQQRARLAVGEDGYQDVAWRADYLGERTSLSVNAQQHLRDRFTELYYGFEDQRYQPAEDVLFLNTPFPVEALTPGAFPDVNQSLDESSLGLRASFDWKAYGKTTISAFDYDADFHTVSLDTASTTFAYLSLRGYGARISHELDQFYFEYSVNRPRQDLAGSEVLDYNMDIQRAHASGDFQWGSAKVHSYATYNAVETKSAQFLGSNNGRTLSNLALGVHLDYELSERWRALAAYRLDQFSTDHENQDSYQLALTYKFSDDNLVWLMHGYSFRSPFVLDTFIQADTLPTNNSFSRFSGNEDLALLDLKEYQFGWRSQLSKQLNIQLDVFFRETAKYSAIGQTGQSREHGNEVFNFTWLSIPASTEQRGATLSVGWEATQSLKVQAHVTAKHTELFDSQVLAGIGQTFNRDYQGSPDVYGGVNLYWALNAKTSISAESSYLAGHRPEYGYGFSLSAAPPTLVSQNIHSRHLLDLGYNHDISEGFRVKLGVKNVFNQTHNEYLFSDPLSRTVYAELQLDW